MIMMAARFTRRLLKQHERSKEEALTCDSNAMAPRSTLLPVGSTVRKHGLGGRGYAALQNSAYPFLSHAQRRPVLPTRTYTRYTHAQASRRCR